MDSRCNKSCTEDNATKVFELIITNPCCEPSEPVEISCVINHVIDLTAKRNASDTMVDKDGTTDSVPIVIDDIENEEVTTADENSSKDCAQKSIKSNKETSNIVKVPVVTVTFDCNDNQKESMESVIILDETYTGNLNQTKLNSGQLVTENVVQNNNLTTDSDIDLYETELQNALATNKTCSRKVLDKPPQNVVGIDTGKSKQSGKAVCTDKIAKKDSDPTTDSDIDFYETDTQNVVALNGNIEDSDVILLDSKTNNTAIIQDDNDINILAKEYPPIDLVAEESLFSNSGIYKDYANEFKENSLLTELVQKCLNMERNGGMSRVINRTLLNIYINVEEKYKKSVALRKVLTRTLMNLHMEPELKFSHIKSLCDHLKLHMVKKRVPFVTLGKRSKGDESTSTTPSKKSRVETIDLDNYPVKNQTSKAPRKPKEYPPIEIDDSSSSIEEVNDVTIVDNEKAKKKKIKKKKKKKQKGGLARAFIPTLLRNPFSTTPDLSSKEIPNSNQTIRIPVKPNHPVSAQREPKQISSLHTNGTNAQIVDSIEEPPINSQPLLTPVMMEPVPLYSGTSDQLDDEAWKTNEIQKIEQYIAFLREQIEKLEEAEVQVDDESSPYIVSEHYQSMVVKQYKRLCELTGTQEKKQHKVRLQVLPGHPEAPVRYLQEFLNDNIDEEGNTPFPDLYDVIQCVCKANVECHMNWGQARIMKEARSLFIQFGLTMQKRRQKREWKDLMSRVKEEVNDPAEQDAELMIKLNRNSWIAKQKENSLLDRYASLEETELGLRMANALSARIENGVAVPETESSDDENANPRVPFSINYDQQENIGSSESITNGNISIPSMNGNQRIVGSTISLSNGHIEISPTYEVQTNSINIPNGIINTPLQINSDNLKNTLLLNSTTAVNSIQNATLNTSIANGIQNVTDPEKRKGQCNNNLSMYSVEFQNFTLNLSSTALNAGKCNLCGIVQSNACFHNTNVSTVKNSSVDIVESSVSTVNNGNVSTVISNVSSVNNSNVFTVNNRNTGTVNSNVSCVNNSNVFTVNSNVSSVNSNISAVNNSNVTTISNNLSPDNNSIVGTVNSEAQSKVDLETATILARNIMELVQKDVTPRNNNGNQNTKEIASCHDLTQKSTDVKCKEDPDKKIDDSVCEIFTHKTKPTNKNTGNENTEVKETPECKETKTDQINFTNQANVETSSKIDTKDVPTEDIVKPEPPDIPRMLTELGEDYTAVVFDIEDPFLVIEISDSSESEDEVT